MNRPGRKPRRQVKRDFEFYGKCTQIAVVDSNCIAVQVEYPIQLGRGMHLAENVQFQCVRLGCQLA